MSASEKRQKIAALGQIIAQTGAGLGGDTPGGRWSANQAQLMANYAQAEAQKEAQKEAEKKAKSKGLGKLGSVLGSVVGTAIGGPVGGMIGGSLGSAGGQAAGGGGVDVGDVVTSGVTGGIGGYMAKGLMPAAQGVAQAAPQAAPTASQMGKGVVDAAASQAGLAPAGAGTVLAPTQNVVGANTVLRPEAAAQIGNQQVAQSVAAPVTQQGGGFFSKLMPAFGGYARAAGMMGAVGLGGNTQTQGQLVRDPNTGQLVFQQQQQDPYGGFRF